MPYAASVGQARLCYAAVVAPMAAGNNHVSGGGAKMTSQLALVGVLGAYLALLLWLQRR